VLEGTLPGRLNDEAAVWTLQSSGDTAEGRLEFRVIVGDPTSAAPDANLQMSFVDASDWHWPLMAVTPIHIDGPPSRGTDLTYFIEYGDGFVATSSSATHVVDVDTTLGYEPLTARVTVVDRFGRSDSEGSTYYPFGLGVAHPYQVTFGSWYSVPCSPCEAGLS